MKALKLSHPFLNEISIKIRRKKQNCLIVIAGGVGTGKSWLALKIAEQLDSAFKVETKAAARKILEERFVVKPEQFSKAINEGNLKTGAVIVLDEAGTVLSNRQWQTLNNKIINFILQTFRYRHLVVIFTVPNLTFLDVQARRMVNYYIETTGIDFNTNECWTSIRKFQCNPRSGIIYRKRLKYNLNGNEEIVDPFFWGRPSIILRKAYEKYAKEFKKELSVDLQNTLEQTQIEDEIKNRPPENMDDIAKKMKMKYPNQRITVPMIRNEYEVSIHKASIIRLKVMEITTT